MKKKTLGSSSAERKIREWFFRYGPAEVVGILTLTVGGIAANTVVSGTVVAAYLTAWSENVGYYGTIFVRDLTASGSKRRLKLVRIAKVVRNLTVEFGPAEYLDSLIVRPFCMYTFPKLTGNLVTGLILGKLSADAIFYLPTVIMYELRKAVFSERTA